MSDDSKRRRRDPRGERAARRSSAPPPAEAETPGRIRRDPRAERSTRRTAQSAEPAETPAARPRIDPRTGRAARHTPSAQPSTAASAAVKVVEDPAYLILAVPDLVSGRLSSHDRDLLGAARGLADAGGGAVLALIFEEPRDDLGAAGVDRVVRFLAEATEGHAPEARTAVLVALAERDGPRHLLFPDWPAAGGDLGRRVAARLGERAATAVWRLAGETVTRRAVGGSRDASLPPPRVLLLAEEAAEPAEGPRREARAHDTVGIEAAAVIEDKGEIPADPETVALAEAEFIVSAGNGVRDWTGFHELAGTLGAAVGGSRVVVDDGHLPRDRQVGASGTLVSARCYLALGISGAPQHLQGITACERVVAVNSDPACEMVKRADLAVVGDVQDVMPALVRLARERRRNA